MTTLYKYTIVIEPCLRHDLACKRRHFQEMWNTDTLWPHQLFYMYLIYTNKS